MEFTDILLIGITNDFARDFRVAIKKGNILELCIEGTQDCFPIGNLIPPNATEEKLFATAENNDILAMRAAKKAAANSEKEPAHSLKNLIKKSKLVRVVKRTWNFHFSPPPFEPWRMDSIKKIREEFPDANITFFHIPEKHEAMDQRYSLNPRKQFEALGVHYFPALKKYDWSAQMYHKRDSHPNVYGYKKIQTYVKDFILSKSPQKTS
jgi:hypothetical protein